MLHCGVGCDRAGRRHGNLNLGQGCSSGPVPTFPRPQTIGGLRRDCLALIAAKDSCGVIWLTAQRQSVHGLLFGVGTRWRGAGGQEGGSPRTALGCQGTRYMYRICLVSRSGGAL
jgi:hypothetical protein